MKLILAIVNHDDSGAVIGNLTKEGFMVTKIATVGGFLRKDNTTIIVGVEDEKVDSAIDIIYHESQSRKQLKTAFMEPGAGYGTGIPFEVTVGGATVFVLNVERFVKM